MKKATPGRPRVSPVRAAAPGPGVSGAELEARRAARTATASRLAAGRTPLRVVAVAEGAAQSADEAVRAAAAKDPPRAPFACREGCAWCCHQTVGVAAPEVLRIAAHLRQTLSPQDLEATRARVRERAAQRQALRPDRRSRARLPCALLVDDRCAAYPVRPLTCRGFNSDDAARCERELQTGGRVASPSYEPQQRLCTFVLDGMRAGLEETRLSGDLLELSAALDIALAEPDAADRWLAGQPVFARARLA
jgi:Fe-S-cluster containining protein